MKEFFEKLEQQINKTTNAKAITSAVITAGVVAIALFGNVSVTIGG